MLGLGLVSIYIGRARPDEEQDLRPIPCALLLAVRASWIQIQRLPRSVFVSNSCSCIRSGRSRRSPSTASRTDRSLTERRRLGLGTGNELGTGGSAVEEPARPGTAERGASVWWTGATDAEGGTRGPAASSSATDRRRELRMRAAGGR
jgi:hypothetical protein